ncbi:MAG: cold-shock' DNA-binding domain-containing protein [Benjaminiella poitrasii]|nr:MAG: cold-shock' DNA-binding domain-containing protein [Benjaminiella poitrasii]
MSTSTEHRHKGHVKFFNSVKGFGFIIPDTNEDNGSNVEEVFVHHTAIFNNGGFKNLAEGEEVEYDLVQGPKGLQAANVTGPDGISVKGDPNRFNNYNRPMYPNYNNNPYYYNNNNNNNGNNNGDFAMNPPYDGSVYSYNGPMPIYSHLYQQTQPNPYFNPNGQ